MITTARIRSARASTVMPRRRTGDARNRLMPPLYRVGLPEATRVPPVPSWT